MRCVWGVTIAVAALGCGADTSGPSRVVETAEGELETDATIEGVDATIEEIDATIEVDATIEEADATIGEADATFVEVADTPPPVGWFSQVMPWDEPVDHLAPHARSAAMIAALAERGGWGNSNRFQIDFSITVLAAGAATPRVAFEPNGDFYEGDCDHVPVPVPPGGALEGEDGYACQSDGDCHLIVRTPDTLYEMWRAHIDDAGFSGGCLAVWDLRRSWPESLRGEGCTSADAAGLPIAPLLFSADEVAAGEIGHAIRFILPNSRISHRQYVRPATHATGAASARSDGMPYGVRLRLRADYPVHTLPGDGARVVARALKRFGMILADGGQIALTAASDRDAAARWAELLGPRDLAALTVEDFEVVDMGALYDWTGDCERNP